MTEILRYGLICKEDLSIGTGNLEARLADGRVVTLTQIRLTDFLSALTTGSVLFVKAGGVAGEDNSNLFWDDTNNRLGIGTASPGAPLHIVGAIIGTTTLGPSASQQHTLPAVASDTYVLLAATQTLTNKTLTSPVINTPTGDVATLTGSQTLTNKTLTTPIVSGAAPATPVANTLYSDGIIKAWVSFTPAGVINADFNVSGVVKNAAGDFTITWATPFANAFYAVSLTITSALALMGMINSITASTVQIAIRNTAGALTDPSDPICVIALGTQ